MENEQDGAVQAADTEKLPGDKGIKKQHLAASLPTYAEALEAVGTIDPKALGIGSHVVAMMVLEELRHALPGHTPLPNRDWVELAVEFLCEYRPQNVTQAMLAAHIWACTFRAGECRRKAQAGGDDSGEWADREIAYLRLFQELALTMEKLQGRVVRQRVVVEHVYTEGTAGTMAPAVTGRTPAKRVGGGDSSK
jgi:hypothetical protein